MARKVKLPLKKQVARTKRPGVGGRPSMLNAALAEQVIIAARAGCPRYVQANYAGVAVSTLNRWISWGDAALEKPAGQRTANEARYGQFRSDLLKAETSPRFHAQAAWTAIATQRIVDDDGNITATPEEQRVVIEAAKSLLRVLDPATYAPAQRHELSGPGGGPIVAIEAEADAIFDKLARLASETPDDDDA